VHAIENAAGASTAWAQPLSRTAEHCRRDEVRNKEPQKVTFVIAPYKAYALCLRDHPELIGASIDIPHDGPDVATYYRLQQSPAPEVGQIDAAPMLALAGSADVKGPTRS
jgi:hypothetical protein